MLKESLEENLLNRKSNIEETNNEFGSAERTWAMGFLGVTIRIWVDRGDW